MNYYGNSEITVWTSRLQIGQLLRLFNKDSQQDLHIQR